MRMRLVCTSLSGTADGAIRKRFLFAMAAVVAACGDPTAPTPVATGRRLAVGELTVCVLRTAGGTSCWGYNSGYVEYRSTTAPSANIPTAVANGVTLQSISTGPAQFMCGVTVEKSGVCWGRAGYGQMANGIAGAAGNAVTPMSSPIRWSALAVGRLTACGINEGGVVYCWGLNQHGELGNTTTALRGTATTPTAISSTNTFKRVSVGWQHACAITTDGDLYCWGHNSDGQLGRGTADTVAHPEPAKVAGSTKWVDVALSSRSTCAIATDATAWCWGFNFNGQLGDNSTTTRSAPVAVATTDKFFDIEMSSGFGAGGSQDLPPGSGQGSFTHTCALRADSTAFCWGFNLYGQLGDNSSTNRLTPVAVAGGEKFGVLGLGGSASCGMRDEYIWCWGGNAIGQLGNASYIDAKTPVKVGPPFGKP
jgi:alpha-tubulin suppressor-like RCC1 family protein